MSGLGQSRDRAERMLKLLAALTMDIPKTLAELRDRFQIYTGTEDAMRRQFLRDKDDLAESGVVVETVTKEGEPAYIIRQPPRRVTLTEAELDALGVLAATISDPATGAALATFAGGAGQFPDDTSLGRVSLDRLVVPAQVLTALVERRQLTLDYVDAKGATSTRSVEPWELVYRRGLNYLVAHDLDRQDSRNFRVDRIVGTPTVGGPAVHERPAGGVGPVHPTETVDAEVLAPIEARTDVAEMGGSVTSTADGMLHGTFAGYRVEPVLGWSLRHDALVTAPPELAEEHRARLQRLLDVHVGAPTPTTRPPTPRARKQTLSVERVRRLMVLPTYLAELQGVTRDELAAALGCTREELDVELELLDLVELPGHGPVGEVSEEPGGGLIYTRHLVAPDVTLLPVDALRLLVLLETVAPVLPGEAEGLTGLRDKLLEVAPASVQVVLHGQAHPDLQMVWGAIADRQVIRFEYKGRKDRTWRVRQVAPDQFRVANGAVYVAGVDVALGEERQFRLDRMGPVEVVGDVPLLAAESVVPTYVPTEPEVEVLLRLHTSAWWVLVHLEPVATTDLDGGVRVAAVRTDAVDWLVGHVMAAAGNAEVVSPPKVRAAVAGRAQAMLDRLDALAP